MVRKKEPEPEDEPTELTRQLDNSIGSYDTEIKDSINLKEVYTEIDRILMTAHKEKKSNLIGDNVKGILLANWFNTFLERSLGDSVFRLDILDELIDDKLAYIISLDKTGLNELLKGISSLSPQVTSMMPPTIIEKLSGIQDLNKRAK